MGEERLRIPIIVLDKVFMPGIKVRVTVHRFSELDLARKFVGLVGSKPNGEPYKIGTLC
jgi:ATP-dependent Lon protease